MNTNFGERIKHLRKQRDLNQSELAKILGVSRTMISAYESDMRKPSYENLMEIVSYFNVSMDWMFGNVENDKMTSLLDLSKFKKEQAIVLQNMAQEYADINASVESLLELLKSNAVLSPELKALLNEDNFKRLIQKT
jgi:Predicted transcriptional regulators